MAKNDFQYCGWNSYTLQCDTIVTLISPSDYTVGMSYLTSNNDVPLKSGLGVTHRA